MGKALWSVLCCFWVIVSEHHPTSFFVGSQEKLQKEWWRYHPLHFLVLLSVLGKPLLYDLAFGAFRLSSVSSGSMPSLSLPEVCASSLQQLCNFCCLPNQLLSFLIWNRFGCCVVCCWAKCVGFRRADISSKYSDRGKSVPEMHGTLNAKSYGGPALY